MMKLKKRGLSLLMAILLLSALLSGCGSDTAPEAEPDLPVEDTVKEDQKDKTPGESEDTPVQEMPESAGHSEPVIAVLPTQEPVPAESYEQIYAVMQTVQENAAQLYNLTEQIVSPEEVPMNPEALRFGDPAYELAETPAPNVESDSMAVTDGERIYMVSTGELVIVSADGADTRELGRAFAANPVPEGYGGSELPKAVYVSGNNVYVITYEYLFRNTETADGGMSYESAERTHVKLFDISDPASPVIMADYAQSGRYLSSFLSNGNLHVISAHSVWMPDAAEPATYVPMLTQNGEDALMDPADIWLSAGLDSTDYTVISAIDAESGSFLQAKAVTGYHAWSEADSDGLYLAGTSYSFGLSEPYAEAQYQVTDFSYRPFTRVVRFSMDGNLELTACGYLEGTLFGDGAMALTDGRLCLAVADSGYSCRIFVDETYGFVNYLTEEMPETADIHIFNSDLDAEHVLIDVMEVQTAYSIRFTGNNAYAMDNQDLAPKYHVDLTADTLQAEALQIPSGFAHQLYWFGDGLTAGVGVSDNEMLMLYLYDDGMNVLTSAEVSGAWNTVISCPEAVQVFPEDRMIAIPVGSRYEVYVYDGTALYQRGYVEMGYLSADTRVFHLDGVLYFCNDAAVIAVNPADMLELARTEFAYG